MDQRFACLSCEPPSHIKCTFISYQQEQPDIITGAMVHIQANSFVCTKSSIKARACQVLMTGISIEMMVGYFVGFVHQPEIDLQICRKNYIDYTVPLNYNFIFTRVNTRCTMIKPQIIPLRVCVNRGTYTSRVIYCVPHME